MSVLQVSFGPLFERFRLGEGVLWAINASLVVALGYPTESVIGLMILSFLVLATMYAVNDYVDAENDVHDPKKNQRLVVSMLRHRGGVFALLLVQHLMYPLVAGLLFGVVVGCAVAAVFGANILYSWWLKTIPVVDVFWVGIWGGLFASITVPPFILCVLVGVMAAISHLFQVMADRPVDAKNRVRTTAVVLPWSPWLVLTCACAAFGAILGWLGAPVWLSVSAVVPLFIGIAMPHRMRWGWLFTKTYFGSIWLLVLLGGYAI